MLRTLACLALTAALVAGCSDDRRRGPDEGGGSDGGGPGADGSRGGSDGSAGGSDGGTAAGGRVGDPCATDADCTELEDLECFTTVGGGMFPTYEFPGGFCSKGCDPDGPSDQCGETAGCGSSSMSGGGGGTSFSFCTPPCSTDDECRSEEGYGCMVIFGGFGFCVPPG